MFEQTRRRFRVRHAVAGLAAVLIAASLPGVVDASDPEAERAAREIQAARDRADAASQAMFDAESELEQLDIDIAAAVADLDDANAEADGMRTQLQSLAARSFVTGGTTTMPLLVDFDEVNQGLTAERFAAVAQGGAAVDLDELEALMSDIADAQRDLEDRQDAAAAARVQFAALQQAAEDEVTRLTEIERQRLIDLEVQRELERQRAARRAAEQAAAEQAAAAAAQQAAAQAASSSSSSSGSSSSGASSSGASSSAPSNAGSGMICPVAGPHAFADTWGAPRSGGRSHQGVDMMASRGIPLVAVESGSASFSTNRLGGNAVWLQGASGTRYYYAHLSAWEGSSRSVSRGDVIGYVGATGATQANHLHFEIHPGGGRAVNPYPYVRNVC